MPVDGYGMTLLVGPDPRTVRPHWWAPDMANRGQGCRRCSMWVSQRTGVLAPHSLTAEDCTPWPAWSLHVLSPAAAAALDANPADQTDRLRAADIIEEAGFGPQAAALRWLADGGKYPWQFCAENGPSRALSGSWGFYILDCTNPRMYHYDVFVPAWIEHISRAGWRYARTRQEAEDTMIALLAAAYAPAGNPPQEAQHAGTIP